MGLILDILTLSWPGKGISALPNQKHYILVKILIIFQIGLVKISKHAQRF